MPDMTPRPEGRSQPAASVTVHEPQAGNPQDLPRSTSSPACGPTFEVPFPRARASSHDTWRRHGDGNCTPFPPPNEVMSRVMKKVILFPNPPISDSNPGPGFQKHHFVLKASGK